MLEVLRKYRSEVIDPYIKSFLRQLAAQRDLDNLYDAMLFHINTGGKRWRPTLCILLCEAYGKSRKDALPLASAIELYHNWTLIHDDIEDDDEIRRDKPTVWKKYGRPHGINIGDGMNEVAFRLLSKGRDRWGDNVYSDLNDLIHKHLLRITEGQTMDMNFRHRVDLNENQYMEMIRRKTGDLVVITSVGGAIIGNAPKEHQKALKEYSYKIGPAFQIRDDLLDYTEGKGRGGEIGCDIKEGKRSLMVIHAFNHLPEKKKKQLVEILDKPREKTTRKDVKKAKNLMEHCDAFEYADTKQKKLANEAKNIVQNYIPDSEAKDLLMLLSQYLIERNV